MPVLFSSLKNSPNILDQRPHRILLERVQCGCPLPSPQMFSSNSPGPFSLFEVQNRGDLFSFRKF